MSAFESLFPECRVAGATDEGGRHWLGVLARRSYRLTDGAPSSEPLGSCVPAARGHELLGLFEADDLSLLKPATDVLLVGSAVGNGDDRVLSTELAVGDRRKSVRVFGRRTLQRTAHGLTLTEPEPIDAVPLDWTRAFGGEDLLAGARSARGRGGDDEDDLDRPIYPRNPFGIGYFVAGDLARLDGALAPQVEDPSFPITAESLAPRPHAAWPTRPVAAGYGPLNRFVFPRVQHAVALGVGAFDLPELRDGSLDRAIAAAEIGAATLNDRFYQCASPGLGLAQLRGDERVVLRGFRPGGRECRTALPGDVPALTLSLPGAGVRRLAPALKSVLVEIDEGRITTTWAGRIEVAMPYSAEQLDTLRAELRWSRAS